MELKQINEVLSDLSQYTLQKKFKLVESNEPRNYWSEKNQGDNSVKTEIYEVDKKAKTFLKISRATDSYGNNESVVGISFVTPKEVKVTAFEAI
jgi:hypothetical protein